MIKDFETWEKYTGFAEGSGRSEKEWIVNSNGEIALFKFRKDDRTYEHCSEKIASQIANVINLPCAKIEIGTYNQRLGCASYLINDLNKKEELKEGIEYITRNRPNYDSENLCDYENGDYYSLSMILESIEEYNLKKDFLQVVIFDYIIGNSDRHHSNWATIICEGKVIFSPIYDNGSSLCCYESEAHFNQSNTDNQKYESLLISKSLSCIRINSKNKKKPKHEDIIKHLKLYYFDESIEFVKNIKNNLTQEEIKIILKDYEINRLMSRERIEFIEKYLIDKLKKLYKIYEI
ncbi:HipA domain-containing protein [Clostridium sp. 1001270J_160509_D11]|uniref:HipA domain-containing protein n=1 Tax=Clostridium sp. 1001270J_160509_D11 TaxID=2787103 RepID=UPI0018A9C344|nr:HipA domain-containing protein [Clostridium sp. 1001270J_160509_D11]